MTIEHASEWLVLINSAVLAIFLILGIATLIAVLALIAKIRRIVKKAESVADAAEAVTVAVKQVATTFTLSNMISTAVQMFGGGKRKK